jgi:hypothetical protein
MMAAELLCTAGWAAYLSAAATVVTFATGILFFSAGQPWGTINDAASVFQVLFMLPVVLALHQLFLLLLGPSAPVLNLLAAVIGTVGMLVTAVLQALLVFGKVRFEQTIRTTLTAGGGIGIWLALVGYLALASGALPGGLAWLGLVAGGGYILLVVGFWLGGQRHPLFIAGSLVALVGYSAWAIWLGRMFLSGTLTASA